MATTSQDIKTPLADKASDGGRLIKQLKAIVGDSHVLTSPESTRQYRTGFRFGSGPVLAVVRPGSLVEQWKVLNACVAANKIIIMQAANTGLTGGSTPDGDDYDREIVIVSTLRMAKVHLIDEGRQVICLPGATLFQLEKALRPLKREPHSVIGSSCIGASVFGGVCNNSGGALIHRGPAFTQMALFARMDKVGEIQLVNHLGVKLGNDPETILKRLDQGDFKATDIEYSPGRVASDHGYADHVRDVDADTPARFNADSRSLFEASGKAGKVMLFAVRLDTFEMEDQTAIFCIGSNDTSELELIRRVAAVVGIPHPKWGKAVAAVVVLRSGARPDVQALTDLVKARKGSAHAPKHIEFVDSLPMTSVGKVDKKALRAKFWAGQKRMVG